MGFYGKIELTSLKTNASSGEAVEQGIANKAGSTDSVTATTNGASERTRIERAEDVLNEELATKVFPVAEMRERAVKGRGAVSEATPTADLHDGHGSTVAMGDLAGLLMEAGNPSGRGARADLHDAFDVVMNILSLGQGRAGKL